jgi:hypothetical protein
MRALHLVARTALRLFPPRRAKDVVDETAKRLTVPFGSLDEARAVLAAIEHEGTCLSRALVVAARLRDAEVVIGVDPNGNRSLLAAHAWVVIDGVPLRASDPRGEEIARL